MRKLLISIFILLINSALLVAQDYYFKSFQSGDECPNMLTVGIQEDSLGYLWVGFSNEGLYRYDGYTFKPVPIPEGSTNLIEIYKTQNQQLLIGSSSGTYIYDYKTLIKYLKINDMMRSFCQSKDGRIYLGTEMGRFIAIENNKIVFDKQHSKSRIGQMDLDSKGNVWLLGDANIISRYNSDSMQHFSYSENSNEFIWSVCVDKFDNVFASSLKSVKILKNNKFEEWELSHKLLKPFANYIFRDSHQRLWFLHLDGITIYDKGKFSYIRENNFKGFALVSVFEDSRGGFWFGTTKGLIRLQNEFCILNPFNLKAEFLLKDIFRDSENRIWTGSEMDGLLYYKDNRVEKIKLPFEENPIILDFFEDKQKNIWISTDAGVFVYNSHKPIRYLKRGIEVPNLPIYSISLTGKNEVWGSVPNGFFQIKGNTYSLYPLEELYPDATPVTGVCEVFTDLKGELWAISDFGLLHYTKGSFQKMWNNPTDAPQAKWGMVQTADSTLWIATAGSGIMRYFPQTKRTQWYGKLQGLISDTLVSIALASNGNIVAGSSSGINKVVLSADGNVDTILSFTKNNGLIDDECLIKVLECDSAGDIWFGSNSGLIKFTEPQPYKASKIIPTYIEHNMPKSENGSYVLEYKSNNISFTMTGIYLLNPSQVSYSYELKGENSKVVKNTQNRIVNFMNLAPGNYTFTVYTHLLHNEQFSGSASIRFTVETPLWLQWYSILFFTITIAVSIWLIMRIWKQRIQTKQIRKEEAKRKIKELELKFLRSQMNPHFLFNSINSIQNLILNEQIDLALNYLNDFSRLIRRVLSYSEKDSVTIQEEIEFLEEYLRLEKLRFKDKVQVKITVDPQLDTAFDRMPPMLVQPVVENAIKHGLLPKESDGLLQIIFSANNDTLKITVEDNGLGRKHSEEVAKRNGNHQSMGTRIIKDRLDILSKNTQVSEKHKVEIIDLYDDNGKPCGTRVIIDVMLY